jgi:hypothetical protein
LQQLNLSRSFNVAQNGAEELSRWPAAFPDRAGISETNPINGVIYNIVVQTRYRIDSSCVPLLRNTGQCGAHYADPVTGAIWYGWRPRRSCIVSRYNLAPVVGVSVRGRLGRRRRCGQRIGR